MEPVTHTHDTAHHIGNHFFPNHPWLGSLVTVCLFVLGLLLGDLKNTTDMHIPPIFIESLQILALTGSIVVAILTVIGFVRKTGHERGQKQNSDEK